MDTTYTPNEIEQKWAAHWETNNVFASSTDGQPYTIMLPPPNVTGTLHMGHGFQHTLMDTLIRRSYMLKNDTLWQPGTDHAGIATQMVVERELAKENTSRHELGREAFLDKAWEWKAQSGSKITEQIKRMGNAMDWQKERFSMDPIITKATYAAFNKLHEDGLIYRGKRLVNWDPKLNTAISDLEVINKTQKGHLWHIRYPLNESDESIVIATTRPETLLGDTAVAVHPDDDRYKHIIGRHIALPLTDRIIPIIADEHVDPEFATGCVKVTPAHDFNDHEIGKRHQLPEINILTPDGHINHNAPKAYQQLDRFEARKLIIQDLEEQNLLVATEDHTLNVPYGDRSDVVIEPMLTDQWFINAKALAQPAIDAVKTGRLKFIPESWNKTYLQWLENIEDWCISRQLWWGHRIPVWYDNKGNTYVGMDEADARRKHDISDKVELIQDSDVLDTWVTAALWPFSSLGWPEDSPELEKHYPSDVLVTGFDIIFFWVARMVMMGLHFMGDVPFREVYITGLIRDSHGQKMSKSKGNILDPIDLVEGITLDQLIEKRSYGLMQPQMIDKVKRTTQKEFSEGINSHGTDALRFTFCSLATTGRDINFDMGRLEGYRNFCNKIWNAARFVIMQTEDQPIADITTHYTDSERWIYSKLDDLLQQTDKAYANYRFDLLAQALYDFTWNEYCGWYLELSKCLLNDENTPEETKQCIRFVLLDVLETLLRLLHPLMPYITEEIWQKIGSMLGKSSDSLLQQPYPTLHPDKVSSTAKQRMEWIKKIISSIRNIRSEMNISPATYIPVILSHSSKEDKAAIEENKCHLVHLAKISEITWCQDDSSLPVCATAVADQTNIHIPLRGLIDKSAELNRLNKHINKLQKQHDLAHKKLNNPNYVNKAPEDVVNKERETLKETEEALAQFNKQLARIESLQD